MIFRTQFVKMLFSAEITDFRVIYNVLRAISFREFALVRPMEEGLKFTLEEMRCVETSAYIPQNMFSEYHYDANKEVVFKISLKVFTECLNIYGDDGSSSIKLSYKSENSPLNLVIKHNDENITVDCEIKTMNVDNLDDVSLIDECNQCKIVIAASMFVEILQRLDNSADEIQMCITPDAPYFKLVTTGLPGESEVNISKHSESFTIFQCHKPTDFKYGFANLRQILKVMGFANKVAISTGESGLLRLQLVINCEEKQMYVEYYITSQFSDD